MPLAELRSQTSITNIAFLQYSNYAIDLECYVFHIITLFCYFYSYLYGQLLASNDYYGGDDNDDGEVDPEKL